MAAQQIRPLAWTQALGRDGWSSPLDIPADRAAEILNMELTGALGKKRDGASQVVIPAFNGAFALYTYFPDQTRHTAWLVMATTIVPTGPGFLIFTSGPSSPTTPPLLDAVQNAVLQEISFTTHGGKLFIAYDSPVNRLHYFGRRLLGPSSGPGCRAWRPGRREYRRRHVSSDVTVLPRAVPAAGQRPRDEGVQPRREDRVYAVGDGGWLASQCPPSRLANRSPTGRRLRLGR